jgi:transposase
MPPPRYPSDLSDEEWAILQPLLSSAEKRGRPPKWPLRHVANAVFYLLRSGCSWRMLPREYPPWQTVYYHFRKWRIDGRLHQAHDRLREAVREAEGRDRDPSAAAIDSQVVKTTPVGGPERGYDGAKRLAGRKRHILVDTGGLVLAARVHGADLPDRDGARQLLEDGEELCRGWSCSGPTGRIHRRIPRVVAAPTGVASGGGPPPGPAAVALRVGGEAARLPGVTSPLGRGAHLRVAGFVAAVQQGLRKVARDGGGDDLRGDEPADAAPTGASGVNHFRPDDAPDWCLPNSL